LQNPNQTNGDNMNNSRRENSTTLRNEKIEYLKEEINDLERRLRTKIRLFL
jgi:hypothetical protein